jgi:hypothetical protein
VQVREFQPGSLSGYLDRTSTVHVLDTDGGTTQRPEVTGARAARFTRRLVIFEDPHVARRLELAAADDGLSVSAAIRAAIRYWLGDWQPDE